MGRDRQTDKQAETHTRGGGGGGVMEIDTDRGRQRGRERRVDRQTDKNSERTNEWFTELGHLPVSNRKQLGK